MHNIYNHMQALTDQSNFKLCIPAQLRVPEKGYMRCFTKQIVYMDSLTLIFTSFGTSQPTRLLSPVGFESNWRNEHEGDVGRV